jgi:hypothetical protein
MRRRQLLGSVAIGLTGGVAGCLGSPSGGTTAPTDASPGGTSVDGVTLPVPDSELRQPLPRDYIPAIVDPAFGDDWRGIGGLSGLPDDAPVLGIEHDGRARAYPLRILNRHEVVNDEFGGPVAVTYCVLCGSGVVVERQVTGEPTEFGVSGQLWRSDLVMYDDLTESLWSQLLATAIRGTRTGDRLPVRPSTLTTWGGWRERQPGTRLLLPPPHSGTKGEYSRSFDYGTPRYRSGGEAQLIGLDSFDGELHPKTLVVGVRAGGVARAYPFPVVVDAGVVNDRIADLPVVVADAPDGTLVAYDRRVGGDLLAFEAGDDSHLVAGGSRWERTTGLAVDGPYDGSRLRRVNEHPAMFWNGWSAFNPGTEVYGGSATD